MNPDQDSYRHKEWLGLLQPVGLVISPPALIKAQAIVDRGKLVELQQKLLSVIERKLNQDPQAWISDFGAFTETVLGWLPDDLKPAPDVLTVALPSYGEILRPTYAVQGTDDAADTWILLIKLVPTTQALDAPEIDLSPQAWNATVQAKFERLLRETNIPQGILCNGQEIRLVYAPSGESSGYITFPVQAMAEVSGRLILGALDLLLGADRLFNVPESQRLPKLLEQSRTYQAEVSNQLAQQVLDALWELLRGVQAADAAVQGGLLQTLAQANPQHIYGGLITTLMRLVFLLYAEDEGLMPDDPVYQQYYAVTGLYETLRADAGNFPDTMDQRYGAWAGLLSLFRLVYDGGGAYPDYLPARHGQLFDPDEYPFLEGRPLGSRFQDSGRVDVPRVSDGVVFRVLDKLLMLGGERLSYRALDVEQIGSVYEAIMGYEVQVAVAPAIALRPKDVVINLEDLLAQKPGERVKWLGENADCKISGKGATALKTAKTPIDVVAALDRRISPRTPEILPMGALFLQPGEERRRSGSHYTPRKLTQPIVKTTLEPVLAALGNSPTPEQILSLKVCDLAMGSAAFLVEACRQLAEQLVGAWAIYGLPDDWPAEVDALLYARRLVAQRCLYGVDKNPFAVNLAKLSLWLVTLAKDRPFTFVDHALKCGDSLVGLTTAEIGSFVRAETQLSMFGGKVRERLQDIESKRLDIQTSDTTDDASDLAKRENLAAVEQGLGQVRLVADLQVAAFFQSSKPKERDTYKKEYQALLSQAETADLQKIAQELRASQQPIMPFNWEAEFPEVFGRANPGFDVIVGNPPFAGKNTLINGHREGYLDWLKELHPESHGNADVVAHFFRRGFNLLRQGGCLGLIATNTIAQGDTRSSGLRFICQHGGLIYHATRRYRWPGVAAVVVSIIHIFKGEK